MLLALHGRWWIDLYRDGRIYRDPTSGAAGIHPLYQATCYRLWGIYNNDRALMIVANLNYCRNSTVSPSDPLPPIFPRWHIGCGPGYHDGPPATSSLPDCYDFANSKVFAVSVLCPSSGKIGVVVRWWVLSAALTALGIGRFSVKWVAAFLDSRAKPGICRHCGYDLRRHPSSLPGMWNGSPSMRPRTPPGARVLLIP